MPDKSPGDRCWLQQLLIVSIHLAERRTSEASGSATTGAAVTFAAAPDADPRAHARCLRWRLPRHAGHAVGYSPPYFLISSNSASVSWRGTSSRATLTLCTWCRMSSTTSGLARVVTSPTSAKLETAAITRRMIFPDLVLGMSGTIHTFLGRAILPISVSIALLTFASIAWLGSKPGFSEA